MLEFTIKRIPGASMCVMIQMNTHLTRLLSWSAVHMAIPRCVLGGETAKISFLISPVFQFLAFFPRREVVAPQGCLRGGRFCVVDGRDCGCSFVFVCGPAEGGMFLDFSHLRWVTFCGCIAPC